MNAVANKSQAETAVQRLDLAIERAELVQTIGRIADRLHELKQSNVKSPDAELVERAAKSLQRRLEAVRRKCQNPQ